MIIYFLAYFYPKLTYLFILFLHQINRSIKLNKLNRAKNYNISFFCFGKLLQTVGLRLFDNKYFQSTMASENTEQTKQKRNELKLRFDKFVQKVNATYKIFNKQQTQKQTGTTQTDLQQIIDDLYNFLAQFGYVFFFNLFSPQPKDNKEQTPVITKFMLMAHYWVKNESKVIGQIHSQLLGICELIHSYCMELQYLFDDSRGERSMKHGQSTQYRLVQAMLEVKKMMEISKYPPKGIKKLNDTQRSTKFIELSKSLLPQIAVINSDTTYASKKQKFLVCSAMILKIWPQTFLEQRTLNRYKQIIERSLKKTKDQNLSHCCSTLVGLKQTYLKQESKFHEHKNYHWPIEMPSIIKHVKKTIVGFLNLEGGIIYVGIKENPDDVLQSVGIYLTSEEIPKFFEWVHDLCDSIYPQLKQDKHNNYDEKYKRQLQKLRNRSKFEQNSQYAVNKCVAVQYLSVIDKLTYEDCYQQTTDQLKRLYLIRIKIKAGCKFDTFHLLKQEKQGEIECFKRNDASVNKLTLEEFFKLYNDRMLDYLNEVVDERVVDHECPKVHFDF